MAISVLVKKPTKAELSARVTKKKDRRSKGRGKFTSNALVVNYLQRTYATDEIIAEEVAEINQFSQPSRMSLPEYAKELWSTALKCCTVYADNGLKGSFIEGLHKTIR